MRSANAPDAAASENIGVVIMIGIAIVAGVGIYAWISGWSGSSDTDSATSRSAALTSVGIVSTDAGGDWKNFTVASASGALRYDVLSIQVDGIALPCADDWGAADSYRVFAGSSVLACGVDGRGPGSEVRAGHVLELRDVGGGLSSKSVELVDVIANRVLLQTRIV